MLTVKCSACSVALKLNGAPPSGKVKCPKCGAVITVAATVPAAASKQGSAAMAPSLDPDDDGFDFGKINFPSASGANAVTQFPAAKNASAYEGPIPGDPLEFAAASAGASEAGAARPGTSKPGAAKPGAAKPGAAGGHSSGGHPAGGPPAAQKSVAKKRSPIVLVGAIAGLLVLVAAGIGAAVMFGGGSGGPKVDIIASAQATAPTGFKAVGIDGCVILMPKGIDYDDLPSSSESAAVRSDGSGSVFMLCAMNGGIRPLDKDQMIKKAERQLGGDILGGTETERNGYKGYKGMLDGSIFLPRMKVEVFHVDERFVIIGSAPYSMGADPSVPVNRQLEAEEEDVFFGSFKVGEKPSGWMW